jgi:hypothetical protein
MQQAVASLLQSELLVREGKNDEAKIKVEESKSLYSELIAGDEPFEVQLEAYKQWIKLATTEYLYIRHEQKFDRVVREYKINKLFLRLFTGIDKPATLIDQQIKINVELAETSRQNALRIQESGKSKSGSSIFFPVTRNKLNRNTQEYNEAACVSHLKLASELGDANSSFALAKIFKENKYFLPYDNPKKKSHEELAIVYAGLAERQGRKRSIFQLAQSFGLPPLSTQVKECFLMSEYERERARRERMGEGQTIESSRQVSDWGK